MRERVKAWERTPIPKRSLPTNPRPQPQSPSLVSPQIAPGLTSVHLFLSCRCTLGDSRAAGAQAVQIPPSPAWCVGEGLGARMYSPEAPEGLRLSAQGPTAGEQASQQTWFLGIQLLGSQTPLSSTFSGPTPSKKLSSGPFAKTSSSSNPAPAEDLQLLPCPSRKSSSTWTFLHPKSLSVLCPHQNINPLSPSPSKTFLTPPNF